MKTVLRKYDELFSPLQGVPPEGRVQHTITLLPCAQPVMKRPYRLSESQRKDVKEQLEAALDKGWIRPSMSAWGTAVLMVPKKDGS